MRNRIGVYICHCGSNISDYVDVEAVKEIISEEDGVVLTKTTMFACSDSAQNEIAQDIRENDLDGLVIASCSPKLHLHTFRNVAERGKLNPYNYIQANIREQCSWAHSDKPDDATIKAVKLVKAAVAKARLSEPLTPSRVSSENVVFVVGAGIAGMRAAIELCDMGSHVFLIEKKHYVGGRVSQLGRVFTTDETGWQIVESLYDEIKKRKNINLFTGAELVSVDGSVGNFKIKIKVTPRYFKPEGGIESRDDFGEKLREAVDVCPVTVPDDFNYKLTDRKALYDRHRGEFPPTPSIDEEACTRCGKCAEILPGIDLDQKTEYLDIKAGAIVLCSGFDPYEPVTGEFGYGETDNVVTLQEFRRLIELNDDKLIYNKKNIKNIAYIYCVGSRQVEGENKYCSRYCCAAAIHTALLVKARFGEIYNYHFHRGVRSYGKLEALYTESSKNGDIYFQCPDDALPVVEKIDGETIVIIDDIFTEGRKLEIEADLVVLVTGMVPGDTKELVNITKVPVGIDRFFNEIHPKLKPVEVVIDGIYTAGTCQFPKNITETINSSLTAAVKASSLVRKGEIEIEPTIARIDRDLCCWCSKCSDTCPFDAILKEEFEGKEIAVINKATCKGCGMCLPVCPVDAIELIGNTDKDIESMIDALADRKNSNE